MTKILVVDDELTIRSLFEEVLKDANHSVKSASNGKEALAILKKETFDLLITDIIMPELDGLELIREIRKTSPDIKIIAMSGGGRLSASKYLPVAGKIGAHKVLKKPVSIDDLVDCVNSLLN